MLEKFKIENPKAILGGSGIKRIGHTGVFYD